MPYTYQMPLLAAPGQDKYKLDDAATWDHMKNQYSAFNQGGGAFIIVKESSVPLK